MHLMHSCDTLIPPATESIAVCWLCGHATVYILLGGFSRPTASHTNEPRMKGVMHRARLYTALVGHSVQWTASSAYRVVTKSKHPLGWTPYQDWSIGFMRVLFQVGGYNHWRNSIRLMMKINSTCDEQLVITPIAPDTFQQQGFRNSYMISLPTEQQRANPKASFVLMYLHGGAFVAGDPLMYKPAYLTWMRQLAAQGIHMRVFAVGYPLAPENTFPAALHGVAEAYEWLVRELGGSDNIILAGDSAGGNLTIAALAYMRDSCSSSTSSSTKNLAAAEAPAGQPGYRVGPLQPPRAAILISPAVDFSSSSVFTKQPFQASNNGTGGSGSDSSARGSLGGEFHWDYISTHENVDVMQLYISSHSPMELSHPLVSPTYIDNFSGLVQKELLVVAGGCEAMTPDIVKFVDKIKALSPSVPLTYHEEANEPHCYCVLSGMDHLIKKGTKVLLPFMQRVLRD